jgi:hypothetical protein
MPVLAARGGLATHLSAGRVAVGDDLPTALAKELTVALGTAGG